MTRQTEKYTLNKTKNATKGILAGLLNRVITLLLPFVVRTILIKKIGIDYAGLNSLFVSILQVLNLAELGFSSAIVYSMYKPVAEQDHPTICALLRFFRRIYRIIALVVLVGGLAVMPFLRDMIKSGAPADINIYIIYLMFLFNTCISYALYGYKTSILNAYQRVDIISHVGSITSLALSICQILVLLLTSNFYLYIAILPITTIANNLITSYIVDKQFPQYKCTGSLSKELRRDIWKKVAGLTIQKLCATSRNTFASIFISAFISLSIVGIYNNYYLVFAALTGIMGLVPAAMTGGIGNEVQVESVEENYRTLQKFNLLYMWISTVITVSLFALYQPFMEIWMGKEYMFGYSTVWLLVIYFYILKMGDIRSIWVDAVGLYWEIKWRAVLEAALNLVLNFIFIQLWGVNGLIIGTSISLFLINFIYSSSITFKYYFGYERLMPYYLVQMGHFAVMLGLCGLAYICFTNMDTYFGITNPWVSLPIRLVLALILTNAVLYVCFCKTKSYKMAKSWLQLKLNRTKDC